MTNVPKRPPWPRTRAEILRPGFSTPLDAPMVPPFPLAFRDVEVLTVCWRTNPEAIRALLPEPLEATGGVAMAHVYKMNDTSWLGPYHEVNVMVGAELPGVVAGSYSPYLYLSSDVGVSHGREVHGQPKKLAEPRLEARGDLVVGVVTRNGIDVLTATMPYKQVAADIAAMQVHFPFTTNLNLKAVDHIDGRPAIRQLTSRRLSEVVVHEAWAGPCTVELRPNAQLPVFRLPVVEPLEGFLWRADFTLVAGEIIHDYLMGSP